MSLDVIREINLNHWAPRPEDLASIGLETVLEAGNVLYFPHLPFVFAASEQRFLSEAWSDGKAKHISYRGDAVPLQGARGDAEAIRQLKSVIARFADQAETLVQGLFPRYQGYLKRGFTSYRTGGLGINGTENRFKRWAANRSVSYLRRDGQGTVQCGAVDLEQFGYVRNGMAFPDQPFGQSALIVG